MEQKISRQGIIFSQYVKTVGRIQRKLRQTEDKTHRDDLYKLTKKRDLWKNQNKHQREKSVRKVI